MRPIGRLFRQSGHKIKLKSMNVLKHKPNQLISIAAYLILFLAGIFYLYYFTGYLFFYQEKSSMFLLTFSYLKEHLSQPGGFLEYLAQLQTAFYYYHLPGTIIVMLEICGIIYLLAKTGYILTGRRLYFLPFLVGAGLFYLQTNYQYRAFNNLGILIQLILFYCGVSYSNKKYEWLSVILFPIFYFLFGGFSLLLIGLFSVYSISQKQWIKTGVIWALSVLFFYFGREILFFQTTESLIRYPFSIPHIGDQTKLFIPIIGLIVLFPLLIRIEINKFSSFSIKKVKVCQLTPFVVLLVLTFLVIPRIDKKNMHYFHVEKLFYEQKYDELIRFNLQFPTTNTLTAFLNNVALAETGNLSSSFFRFPQSPDGKSLFLDWQIVNNVLERGGYFYYALGMINEAQRWAYEYMVMKGNSPEVLKMMIKTELIKGNYKIAEKYIDILEHSLFYRDEAKKYRTLLYNDKAVEVHPELGKKRALDTKVDFFVLSENPPANLDLMLQVDSTNIPAIEYKLAWLMFNKDMEGVVKMLPIMEQAGYKELPQNVEEAVATYKLLKVGEMPDLKTLRIKPQTEQRFQQYYKIFQQNQGNKQRAQQALAKNFRDTYWYHVFFD